MYSDKITQSIVDAVSKVLEEELKGNQHKIDANKNGKVDAHDFKILRGEKKAPFEGGKKSPETVTDKSGAKHGPMSKARDLARRALRKEDIEQIDEDLPGEMHPEAGKVLKHIKPEHHSTYKPFLKKGVYKGDYADRTAVLNAAQKSGHMNEEIGLEEGWAEMEKAAKEREAAKGTGNFEKRKVSTGTVYTRIAKQDDDEEENKEPKSRKKQKLGSTSDLMSDEEFKKKHGMSRKNYERMKSGVKIGESFSSFINAYRENGLSALTEMTELVEEPDNEQWTKELKDQEASMSGKKKQPEVAKAGVKAVHQEEVDLSDFSLEELEEFMVSEEFEQLDEVSLKTKIKAYAARSGTEDGGEKIRANIEKKHGSAAAHHADRAADRAFGGRPMVGGYSKGDDSLKGGLRSYLSKKVTSSGKIPKQTQSAMKSNVKNRNINGPKGRLPEEFEQLDEVSLKTKIKAYAARSGDEDSGEKAEKIRANIEKKHGSAAAHHADRAADRAYGGRPMVGGYSKGDDSLKGGLRRYLSKGVTKSGVISKQTQNAMKSSTRNITGPKGRLPEEFSLEDFSLEELEYFMMSEEFQQLDELSKDTLGRYVGKMTKMHDYLQNRHKDLSSQADAAAERNDVPAYRKLVHPRDATYAKLFKVKKNLAKANKRLNQEEVEQVEEGAFAYGKYRSKYGSSTRTRDRYGRLPSEHNPYENPNKPTGNAPQSDKELKDRERNAGVREEVELGESLGSDAKASDWIHDFVHSDNPKFEGKSKKERMQMALAAYYSSKRNK